MADPRDLAAALSAFKGDFSFAAKASDALKRRPDTLEAGEQTNRERIAAALAGDSKPGSLRRQFVNGLTGGLGQDRFGVLDLTPLGLAFVDESARKVATPGQRAGGLLELGMIGLPAARGVGGAAVKSATKAVGREGGEALAKALVKSRAPKVANGLVNPDGVSAALDMSQAARMARAGEQGFNTPAYHGTPRGGFDGFDLGRVGTVGENYGPAIYATDSPAVANSYALAGYYGPDDIAKTRGDWDALVAKAERLGVGDAAIDSVRRQGAEQVADIGSRAARSADELRPTVMPVRMRMDGARTVDAGGAYHYQANPEALSDGGPTIIQNVRDYGGANTQINPPPATIYATPNPGDIRSAFDPFHPGGEARVGLPRPGDFQAQGLPTPTTQPAPPPPQIVAYHGSPHDFDQFSLDKIGTGEGAQAYGHGLYFAENEAVAKGYRDQIAGDGFMGPDGKIWSPSSLEHLNVRAEANRNGADLDSTISRAQELLKTAPEATRGMLESDIAELTRLRDAGGIKPNPGSVYQVGINADPEHFLDWDKPLSEQSDAYRQRLDAALKHGDTSIDEIAGVARFDEDAGKLTGETIYDSLGRFLESPEAATSALQRGGVPGIKYLDQGSRNAGGWHITPPSETVSGKWMVKGSDYNSKGLQFDTEAEAKTALAEKIGGQTRNFVVFDEKLITILKKYGWVPGAVIPGAAMMEILQMQPQPQSPAT